MNKYITKEKSINVNKLIKSGYSLSPFSYRTVECANKKIKTLAELILQKNKGFEPGSDKYTTHGKNYFVRITDLSTTNYTFYETEDTIKISSEGINSKKQQILKGDLCFQTASDVGNVCIYNGEPAYYNSHIIKLEFEESLKYYIFGILKSEFGRAQVDVGGSIKGVDNFNEELLLNINIPFPNHEEDSINDNIIKYISVIVKNIINKEECIKDKNRNIDILISKELDDNQKEEKFIYSYPTRDLFITSGRMDASIYEEKVKRIEFKIKNYKNGYYYMGEKFNYSRGQNLQVSQIGESIYSNVKKDNFYRMFTNIEMQDDRTISGFRWLGNKNKLDLLPNKAILLAADGMIVGRSFFFDEMENTITNLHPWIIMPKDENMPIYERAFLSIYLSYLKNIGYLNKIKDKSNGGGLKKNHLDKWIIIPKFDDEVKNQISQQYYNNSNKNIGLTLDNYLEKEIKRNKSIGIYQLNMELFELRKKLEDTIDKLVLGEAIDIDFKY